MVCLTMNTIKTLLIKTTKYVTLKDIDCLCVPLIFLLGDFLLGFSFEQSDWREKLPR